MYGASEGLEVLVLESEAPGGQAGSSSKIENYLGFPTGISGQDLAARRAYPGREVRSGAHDREGREPAFLRKKPFAIEIDGGSPASRRATVVIATGARYRRSQVENLERVRRRGRVLLRHSIEAQLCRDEEVIVVGGGNSAGQAAVFLAQTAKRVHLLVRAEGLADSMSRYLIRRIEDNPASSSGREPRSSRSKAPAPSSG